MKLTKNFTLAEFEHSDFAESQGIDNTVPDEFIPNLQALATNVLQPLRDYMGNAITVNSGYRCKELNALVGGVQTSHHLRGYAADIVPKDLDKAFAYIKDNLPFTQLIYYVKRGFLHVSYIPTQITKEVLYA